METGMVSPGWERHPYFYRSSCISLFFSSFNSVHHMAPNEHYSLFVSPSLFLSSLLSLFPPFLLPSLPPPFPFLSFPPFFPLVLFPSLCLSTFFSCLSWSHLSPRKRWEILDSLHSHFLCFHAFPAPSYNVMPIIRKYNSLCLTLLFIIYLSIFFTFLISLVSERITAGKLTAGLRVTRGENIIFTGGFSVVCWGYMIFLE